MWHDIAAEGENEYNTWHTRQHMPERLGVPGFLVGRRYVNWDLAEQRWFTLYEAATLETLSSDGYRARLNDPTHWSGHMQPHFRNFTRSACVLSASVGRGIGGALATFRLDVPPTGLAQIEAEAHALAHHMVALPGVVGAHIGVAAPGATQIKTRESELRVSTGEDVFDAVVMLDATGPREMAAVFIALGLEPPTYGPRTPRSKATDAFLPYLRDRLAAYPGLTAVRLCRELRQRGFAGSYTGVKRAVQELRPDQVQPFEVRFETPPGAQGQVDFARFEVTFTDEPGVKRIVWLFSLVLGYSRLIWARFVLHQDLGTVLRCHVEAFQALGGAPREILYDRMKTAVLGQDVDGLVIYNRALLDLARHFGFQPKACRSYRPQTKGKVERPFRYIREDFFLAGSFRNLEDLNGQLRHWLNTVANPRVHATTLKVVNEAFAEERPALMSLPLLPYRTVLRLERRISNEGMISVGGNTYSVPDTTRRRVLEVHSLVDEIRILEAGVLIASHAPLQGRHQACIDPAHRRPRQRGGNAPGQTPVVLGRTGDVVARRSLDFYDALGRVLAVKGRA